jgi:hypothetical protein
LFFNFFSVLFQLASNINNFKQKIEGNEPKEFRLEEFQQQQLDPVTAR